MTSSFEIRDLTPADHDLIEQLAALMVAGFAEHWPGSWPDRQSGLDEVHASLTPDRISLVAVDPQGQAVGWIGGLPGGYENNVWELHPLVVAEASRWQGIGRALVAALAARVARRGGLTLTLGTDDVDNMTTLGGVDLYPDALRHLAEIRNLAGHPYEFYQRCGFVLTGVMPDANGFGKPDIYLCKRVGLPPGKSEV